MTITLSEEAMALVGGYCQRTGLTHEAALEDLLRRGFERIEWRELRDDVADVRGAMLDLVAGQDALAPYSVALLGLLAHWIVTGGGAKLSEEEFHAVALDNGRQVWDALLAGRGIPAPARPLAEQPASVS